MASPAGGAARPDSGESQPAGKQPARKMAKGNPPAWIKKKQMEEKFLQKMAGLLLTASGVIGTTCARICGAQAAGLNYVVFTML